MATSLHLPEPKTGPTHPQPTGVSAGDEPHLHRAADMDDERPDHNEYYLEDYHAFAEDPNLYKKGGFHPVRLGDRFGPSGRYRVFNKLGFGGFGTVWLCRDTLEGKWRALKITSAYDKTKPVRDAYRELMIKQHLDLSFEGDLAHHHVCIPTEYFWIRGPNGHHLCSIMPVFGPSLAVVYWYYGLHPNILKDVCFQLAQSIKFLHSHGICHGDFRPDNILFQLADGIDEWSEEDMNRVLGPPQMVNVYTDGTHRRDPGIPAYVVTPRVFRFSSGVCSSKIAVVDFGVAYHVNTPPARSGIPFAFAAPEELLARYPIGFASDMWSLACTMSAVYHGYSPFSTDWSFCRHSVISKMEGKIGPLPKPYRSAWNRNLNFEFENDENDETLPVSIPAQGWARDKEELKTLTTSAGLRVDNRLLFPFVSGNSRLYINTTQSEEIARALDVDKTRLPGFTDDEDPDKVVVTPFENRVKQPIDVEDAKTFCDLLRSVFKWDPNQRASINTIMGHPWFEGRDRDNRFGELGGLVKAGWHWAWKWAFGSGGGST